MEIVKGITLDLLPTNEPALSATSDVPIIETQPDASPVKDVPAADKETPKAADTAPAEPAKLSEDSSATPEEAKKPAKGVQKRIDELTRQREDERRAREAAEARELRILAALERATGVAEKPAKTETEPLKPKSADFGDPDAYDNAVEDWIAAKSAWIADKRVAQRLDEENKKREQEVVLTQQKAVQDAFNKRVETARAKYPDYSEVAESAEVQVSFPMAYAILNSEQGPDIQYYLGKNPAEAERISSYKAPDGNPDVARQLVELGIITARLTQAPEKPKPVSAAPKPISPISKSSETAPSPEEESMEQYAARRTKELNSVRPGVRH